MPEPAYTWHLGRTALPRTLACAPPKLNTTGMTQHHPRRTPCCTPYAHDAPPASLRLRVSRAANASVSAALTASTSRSWSQVRTSSSSRCLLAAQEGRGAAKAQKR